MAKVFRAPIDPPEFGDMSNYFERCTKYERELSELAKSNGTNPLLGEILRWQRGDGYANYMVWNIRPLELIWLESGDAWSVEEALIRGLNLNDVKGMVERDSRMREIFGGKS